MQILPGMMEGSRYYPTQWAANLAHYDPHTHLLIAETGYGTDGLSYRGVRSPLFPMLTRAVMQVSHLDGYVVMFWISKLALLAGLIGVYLLTAHLHGEEQADRAVLYMAYPILGTGYTWLMSYPEALHLALWVFGFLMFFQRRYYICGLLTILSVWTRPHAILIVPVFALALLAEQIKARGIRGLLDTQLWLRGLVACGLPLVAFSAWVWYVSTLTGMPLSPINGQAAFGRGSLVWPWIRAVDILVWPLNNPDLQFDWRGAFDYFQILIIVVSFAILIIMTLRRRLPWPLLLFTALSILIPLSTHTNAIGRYALLTWLPLAAIYAIPKRYDRAVMPFGAAVAFLLLTVIGLTTGLSP